MEPSSPQTPTPTQSGVLLMLPFEPTSAYLLGVEIGIVAIVLFCFSSFNKHAEEYSASEHEALFLPREQTGHAQYLIGFCLYLTAYLILYATLCAIGPKIVNDLLSL